ncbi:MAG: TRAP transporter substrate-binding protein DctP [Hyphomicrobiaceae bacterium]|nr:TRAP transporter substrate-binding protein DctP [Hyphomicrobiaceae bacterium]
MKDCLVCVGVLLASMFLGRDAGAQQVKLRAAIQLPIAAGSLQGDTLKRFKEEVERRSNGTVAVVIFDNGTLFGDAQMVDAVASGAVEIGITASQEYVERAPSLAILDLPFFFNFRALAEAAAKPNGELRRLIDATLLTDVGLRVLLWQSIGDTHFFSKGRDVADPARLKDQRVVTPGDALNDFVVSCGGKPTTAPVFKFHDLIKGGTHDAALMTLSGVNVLNLWKVQDTITLTTHARVEFILVINDRVWKALSPRHRAVMMEAARAVEREGRARLAEVEKEDERFARSKGIKLVPLTPDQVAEWRACTADLVIKYMEKNGEKARRLMSAYRKLRTDPCCTEIPGNAVFTRH